MPHHYFLTDNVPTKAKRYYVQIKGRRHIYNKMIEQLLTLAKDAPDDSYKHKAIEQLCAILDSKEQMTNNFKIYLCSIFNITSEELFSIKNK